jgi:membrane protein YqaA with SNARE-associated domain
MKLFSTLYDKVMGWAVHRHASYYLAGLSFAESSFFPIPPDVMLAPMALARPPRAWFYATLTTLASVAGGVAGYLIGMFAFELIEPVLHELGYWEKFTTVQQWFDEWGFWAIFIAGFSPIPYKLFTISAGVISMTFLPFVIASFFGRGGRFFLVAAIMVLGGERMEKTMRTYIDWIGWIMVLLIAVLYFILRE